MEEPLPETQETPEQNNNGELLLAADKNKMDFDKVRQIFIHYDIHTIGRTYWRHKDKLTPEQESELNQILTDRQILRAFRKGLRGFNVQIGEQQIPVLALNEKNAIRKVTGERVKPKKVVYCNDYSCKPKKQHKQYELPPELLR